METYPLISLGPLQIFCIIIIVVILAINSQIRFSLGVIPAKKRDDLQGGRRFAIFGSGILVFLLILAVEFLGYTMFFGNYPSIVALIIIPLIALAFGLGQVIKLRFIDTASVKTYEWLDRSEKEGEG